MLSPGKNRKRDIWSRRIESFSENAPHTSDSVGFFFFFFFCDKLRFLNGSETFKEAA